MTKDQETIAALRYALREIADLGADEEHEDTDPEELFIRCLDIAAAALSVREEGSK